MPSYEFRNGRKIEIPETILDKSGDFVGTHNNSVIVRGMGTHVASRATINGTLTVSDGVTFENFGTVNGTVNVASGANYVVHGAQNGTSHVEHGGKLRVAPGGMLMGIASGEGELVNEGTRASTSTYVRRIVDAPGSRVRQPDEVDGDGTTYFYS